VLSYESLHKANFFRAGVFEEEDFQPSVYGYNLAVHISDSKAASMLRDCEDDLQKKCKLLKSDESKNEEMEKAYALLCRLRFTRVFHILLLHIWKRDDLDACQKLISTCLECLMVVQKTGHLGVQRCDDEHGNPIGSLLYFCFFICKG